MTESNQQLGQLESVHPLSPVYLQRALIIIVLSFIFFLAMLITFSLRQQVIYFILATAFLIVKLFTLFGLMMQRKKLVRLYQNGFTYGKQSTRYDEIEKVNLKQINPTKQTGEIIKTSGEKIVLPEAIYDVQGIIKKIELKLALKGVKDVEKA
jgi:hypothetical protein